MAINACSCTDCKTVSKGNVYKQSMLRGAAIAGGFSAASTLYNNAVHPDRYQAAIKEFGGKAPYFKTLATGLAVTAFIGGVLCTALTFITNKIAENRNKQS